MSCAEWSLISDTAIFQVVAISLYRGKRDTESWGCKQCVVKVVLLFQKRNYFAVSHLNDCLLFGGR